ncbi:unnamed protein product [Trichobilharzia regenti]|nr:unnamed protein product [Trichobilharzia regenti]
MSDSVEHALIDGFKNERWTPATKLNRNEASFNKGDVGNINETRSLNIPVVHHPPPPAPPHHQHHPRQLDIDWNPSLLCTSEQSLNTKDKAKLSTASTTAITELFQYSSGNFNITNSQTCQTVIDLLWRLYKLKRFVQELNWPQANIADALDERVRVLCAQMLREAVKR